MNVLVNISNVSYRNVGTLTASPSIIIIIRQTDRQSTETKENSRTMRTSMRILCMCVRLNHPNERVVLSACMGGRWSRRVAFTLKAIVWCWQEFLLSPHAFFWGGSVCFFHVFRKLLMRRHNKPLTRLSDLHWSIVQELIKNHAAQQCIQRPAQKHTDKTRSSVYFYTQP